MASSSTPVIPTTACPVETLDTCVSKFPPAPPPELTRYTSDTNFEELITNETVDAGDMCDLDLLQSEEEEEEEAKSENASAKNKRPSISEDRRMQKQNSTWSFSLGSFDDTYSEEVSAAIEDLSFGTTTNNNDSVVAIETPFSVLHVFKHPNSSQQHNAGGNSKYYQPNLHDLDSDEDQQVESTNETNHKESS